MRKLSSLASKAATEIERNSGVVQNTKRPKFSRLLKANSIEKLPQSRVGASIGKLGHKDSNFGSISTRKSGFSVPQQKLVSKTIDHQCISEILSKKYWHLLLNHEFKSSIHSLSAQVVISILQKQESALALLRFYVWLNNVSESFCMDQSIRRVFSDALVRTGPVLLSGDLVRDIKHSGYILNEDLLCILIGSWGRLGLAKYCSQVFDQISYLGILPSTRLYNAVIDALIKSNSLDLAYLKFQQMEVDNCARDRFTYNILIHGVFKANVLDEAPRLVKQMEGMGYFPNVFTYTIMIDGYCRAKRVDEAFRILETMKARNVRPNDATYRSLVNGVFHSLPSSEAFESLFGWVNKEQNLPKVVYDSIIYSLCSNSLSDHLIKFLRAAFNVRYIPDSSLSNMVITSLLKRSNLEESCELFEYFISHGANVDFSTRLALIEKLYRERREEKGNLYLSWVIKEGLIASVFSYNMLIDCFRKAKLMNRAMKALEMMSGSHFSPNLVTFNTLISGYGKCRDATKAREMLLMLLEHGCKPDVFTFSSIIDVLSQVNQIADAFDCFEEMVSWEVSPNAVIYNTLIRALCISGKVAKAVKLFRKMQVDGLMPDVFTFNALIQMYCKFHRISEAQRLLRYMIIMGICPDKFTYIAFINAFCESGKLAEAKQLLCSMEANGCKPDVRTCHAVIDAFIKAERIQEAKDIWFEYKARGTELHPMLLPFGAVK